MWPLFLLSFSFHSFAPALALQYQVPLGDNPKHAGGPNLESARANAPQIFNSVHSSMRQWGSSLNHNGMSFFPVSIPARTQLYHGTNKAQAVTGMEWLAFEIEHAETFARSRSGPPGKDRPDRPGDGDHRPPVSETMDDRQSTQIAEHELDVSGAYAETHGYLHEYRTTRVLDKLLYIDGMSAGKTNMGTLDSQDFLLRNYTQPTNPSGDFERARNLCALGAEWEIEGFLRMEAGFELIFCNFTDGLELVSANQRPDSDKLEGYNDMRKFEYMRGVGMRYHGITAKRVEVDYSAIISAYFYPLNLTNSDPSKSSLPRLSSSNPVQLAQVKSDLQQMLSVRRSEKHPKVDWQGVVDMIVTRYSDRLQFMVSDAATQKIILSEINFLLTVFTDYSPSKVNIPAAIERCSSHYLSSVAPQTYQDHLIHAAILTVSQKICSTLFAVWKVLLDEENAEQDLIEDVKSSLVELMDFLSWSTWLECGKCAYDEVCYVAIWPQGRVEDHERPGCVKNDDVDRRGYWDSGW